MLDLDRFLFSMQILSFFWKPKSALGHLFFASWVDFPPQLATQNPPKSIKNRCQDAFSCWLHFLIDFSSNFSSTSIPRIFKIILIPKEKWGFFKKLLLEVGIDFWSILVPTYLHFSSKIHQNPSKNRLQDVSIFRSIFTSIFYRFFLVLGRKP